MPALMSLSDFLVLKNGGNWPAPAPVAIPMDTIGVACRTCGQEISSDKTPVGADQPPKYHFHCYHCGDDAVI